MIASLTIKIKPALKKCSPSTLINQLLIHHASHDGFAVAKDMKIFLTRVSKLGAKWATQSGHSVANGVWSRSKSQRQRHGDRRGNRQDREMSMGTLYPTCSDPINGQTSLLRCSPTPFSDGWRYFHSTSIPSHDSKHVKSCTVTAPIDQVFQHSVHLGETADDQLARPVA